MNLGPDRDEVSDASGWAAMPAQRARLAVCIGQRSVAAPHQGEAVGPIPFMDRRQTHPERRDESLIGFAAMGAGARPARGWSRSGGNRVGLFNKKPKLPSYAGVGLDGLLRDPEWSYAIGQAGIIPSRCEVVLRISEASVGMGIAAGGVVNASPVILFGQGTTLAMAYPTERDVKVQLRETSRAALQTQRSGWFQILFGAANNLDGFMFWGAPDNIQLGTPEGEKFGQIMSAFLKGQLKPQQVVGTPQSLVATAVSVEPPAPAFSDPQDALRWKMVYSVQGALTEMMDKYQECFEQAETVEKAYGMANADYVDGVQQHPISKENFRMMAESMEAELKVPLAALREKTSYAASQWKDLVFLLPGADNDVIKISDWCESNGVPSETLGTLVGNCMFIYTDFGLTRESFWTENQRVISVLNRSGM